MSKKSGGGSGKSSSSKQSTPVARVSVTTNSNRPAANTRTVTPINGASQRQANAASAKSASGSTSNKKGSIGSAVRASGSNGNLSKNEALKIGSNYGKSFSQVVDRLDQVNSRRIDNGKGPIGLGSGAANAYTSGKLGYDWKSGINSIIPGAVKQGPIATALRQMMPSYSPMRQGQGGYSTKAKRVPKGQQVFGSFDGFPQLRIKPALTNNSGFDSQVKPITESVGTGNETVTDNYIPPELPQKEEPPTEPDPIGMMSGGGAGINSATGVRRKKSSWKTQGLSTKGTSTQNRSLTINSFNV